MSNIILKSENLVKSFNNLRGVKLDILKSVSLEIVEEKITMIFGASGAGKSTLLHLLGGLDRPDDGKIFFKDENILNYTEDKLARFRNQRVGFIFQFHHLLPEFTALENVAIPQLILRKTLDESLERANELLTEVGLAARKDHKPAELSGGEQQRVAVARALVNNPDIILADEPTGNLDSVNSNMISELIQELNTKYKKTFLIVTHNQEMKSIADYIYDMKDGRLNIR